MDNDNKPNWNTVALRLQSDIAPTQSVFAVTAQANDAVLAAAGVEKGDRLLDVGCGPGDFVGAALERGVDVVGIDSSAEMIEIVRRRHPRASGVVGSGDSLPFDGPEFDAVVCNFCVNFLVPEKAFAEAHRVLKPKGRYALTFWDVRQGFLPIVFAALSRHAKDPPRSEWAKDTSYYVDQLRGAGLAVLDVKELPLTIVTRAAAGVLDVLRTTGRTRQQVEEQEPNARQRIEQEIIDQMTLIGDSYQMAMPAILITCE